MKRLGNDFRTVCDRVIELLGTADIPVTIIIARVVGTAPSDIVERIEREIGAAGFVGVLADGRIGVLHVGPRVAGARGRDTVEQWARSRLTQAVAAASVIDRPLRVMLHILHTTALRLRTEVWPHGQLGPAHSARSP